MQSFPYEIKSFETDYYGAVSPKTMMSICIYATSLKAVSEGLLPEDLYDKHGAVWMLARINVEQYSHVHMGAIELCVSSRCISGGTYTRRVDVVQNGNTAATAHIVFIVVNIEKRNIIRPSVIEDTWPNIIEPVKLSPVRKIILPDNMEQFGEYSVEYKECDANRHFSSANYAGLICERCGYWSGKQKLMTNIQIEFNAEFKPGESIELFKGSKGEMQYLRGIHSGGATGFVASWSVE